MKVRTLCGRIINDWPVGVMCRVLLGQSQRILRLEGIALPRDGSSDTRSLWPRSASRIGRIASFTATRVFNRGFADRR